jgi:hypothetical protein
MELTPTQIEALKKGRLVRVLLPEIGEDVVILLAHRFDELEAFLNGNCNQSLKWDLGQGLFGKIGSGRSDIAANADEVVLEKNQGAARRV